MTLDLLTIAGGLSLLAAILHICVALGGAPWYRFFGAGDAMVQMAENGSRKPMLITLVIATILFVWASYAFSGAGWLPEMPFLVIFLSLITLIYLLRGIGGLVAPFVTNHQLIQQNSISFWICSSVICLLIGLCHLFGLIEVWPTLLIE
jgi:hypothetical protein